MPFNAERLVTIVSELSSSRDPSWGPRIPYSSLSLNKGWMTTASLRHSLDVTLARHINVDESWCVFPVETVRKGSSADIHVLLTRSAVATALRFKVHATATATDTQSLASNLLHLVRTLALANQRMRHCR